MQKDITILNLLDRLKSEADLAFLNIDYWNADLCAIGLKNGTHLAYVSTFNYTDSITPLYDFDFEILPVKGQDMGKVIKAGRAVPAAELLNELRQFFVRLDR